MSVDADVTVRIAVRGFYTPMEYIDSIPGGAVDTMKRMPDATRFMDHISDRLHGLGVSVRYAREQLVAHPEVSLDTMCATLKRLANAP
jgi:hypothetical protein